MKTARLTLLVLLAGAAAAPAEPPVEPKFQIARLRYSGGGDWYGNETSWINLLQLISQRTRIDCEKREATVSLKSNDLFYYPLITLTGHGQVEFSDDEAEKLRQYLVGGGFLWADDDFGMDPSFRKAMKKVFPDREFVELPKDHPIFSSFYELPDGLPKVHEHAGGAPRAFGLVHDGRLVTFYSFNTDIGDSLADAEEHQDSPEVRERGQKMALNVVLYALTH